MKFFQYFLGIVLAQISIFSLILLNSGSLDSENFLRITIPALFIALVISFWFYSIAQHHGKDILSKEKDKFANEKEELQANAQRAKDKIRKEAQKEILKETSKVHAKANFKVGASFIGVIGVGALFVMAQMMTAGLLVIAGASGAMGGYYIRGKRNTTKELPTIDVQAIENKPKKLTKKKEK